MSKTLFYGEEERDTRKGIVLACNMGIIVVCKYYFFNWQNYRKRWIAYTYTKSEPSCIIESGWFGYTFIAILFRLTAVFREIWRPWKQVFTKTPASVIHMLWDFCQKVFKVFIWFQVI